MRKPVLATVIVLHVLAIPERALAADQGNVLRAVKAGAQGEDVLLDWAGAPATSFRVTRDGTKDATGTTTHVPLVAATSHADPGAVPVGAGSPLFYQVDGLVTACSTCAVYAAPANLGSIGEPALTEASGVVASRDHPGVLWLHNDSGDSARFFAIATDGTPLGEFRLAAGASNSDWEDISLGPCPTGTCLYLGDHGDNNAVRSDCGLYRVAEPVVEVGSPVGVVTDLPFEFFPFSYPDGPRDAEALMVHPASGDVYVVSKIPFPSRGAAYKFPQPLTPGLPVVLTKVADLPSSFIAESPVTGGDIHPCDQRLLLRTFDYGQPFFEARVLEATLAATSPFDDIFALGTWTMVPSPVENQGEAVGYDFTGTGYYTASEGSAEPVWHMGCQ